MVELREDARRFWMVSRRAVTPMRDTSDGKGMSRLIMIPILFYI